MRLIFLTLLVLLLLFTGNSCTIKAQGSETLYKKITKSINQLEELPLAQKDSLFNLRDSLVATALTTEQHFLSFAKGFIALDRQYATTREAFATYISEDIDTQAILLTRMAQQRMAMRSQMSREQWREFTIVEVKPKKEDQR